MKNKRKEYKMYGKPMEFKQFSTAAEAIYEASDR